MSQILQRIPARPASDGAGVKIRRIIPSPNYGVMDPFLMLDEIRSDSADDYGAGFPPHPHRGFETITYLRQGALEHEDHMGNRGVIHAGGAQWMTAGRGVIHSEMPVNRDGAFHGFQLWLNLPATEKLRPPEYHNLQAEDIPRLELGPHEVKVLAGRFSPGASAETSDPAQETAVQGPIGDRTTQPQLWDLTLAADEPLQLALDPQLNTLVFVYEGSVSVDGRHLAAGELARVQHSGSLELHTESGAGLLLLAGRPLGEPVAQYGPFVMNTRAEIEQAIADYQSGALTAAAQ
ncbi:MAG: pirin family protein [Pseudomonadota bacterium]|nr:pirin family protein [Pseudomonadota bacterium]